MESPRAVRASTSSTSSKSVKRISSSHSGCWPPRLMALVLLFSLLTVTKQNGSCFPICLLFGRWFCSRIIRAPYTSGAWNLRLLKQQRSECRFREGSRTSDDMSGSRQDLHEKLIKSEVINGLSSVQISVASNRLKLFIDCGQCIRVSSHDP